MSQNELMKMNLQQLEYFEQGTKALRNWKPEKIRAIAEEAQVLDLFSGCGGMSLGFAALGKALGTFRMVGAADIDNVSLSTYERNFKVPAIKQDVRNISADSRTRSKFLESLENFDSDKPTVLIGCAPCQGFSSHGKKRWDIIDDRNSLINAFTKIAVKLQPECVVMENVPELLSHRYWNHFKSFKKSLESNGYTVKSNIYNAASYGAPQERFRALIIAMKKPDFSMPGIRYRQNEFRTVRDAIGKLPPVLAGVTCPSDPTHKSASHRESTLQVIRAVPVNGGNRPIGVGPKCLDKVKGFSDVYGRLYWDRPSITLTHYARNPASGRYIHPDQDRGLTMREAARLQGFPDTFEFEGGFDDTFRQIGEAVSPLFATAVAATVLSNLRDESNCDKNIEQIPVSNSYSSVISGLKRRHR